MDIRQLRYFVSIIDSGSLSKAAEQLCIAQPALSQQVASLEGELGQKLLLRSSQGVTPTDAGQILYRHARTILRQLEEARQDVREGGIGISGQVAVGFPTSLAAVLAVPLLKAVRVNHPGIHLQIFESESGYLAELLAHGRLDMALLFRDTGSRGIIIQPLLDEELFVFGPLSLLARPADQCHLSDLDGIPMMLPSSKQGLRLLVERCFARYGATLNVVAEVDSLPTIMAAAREGLGCTILPSSALAGRNDIPDGIIRRLVEPSIRRPASLCWPGSLPRNSASIAVQETIVLLVRQMVEEGAWQGARLRA